MDRIVRNHLFRSLLKGLLHLPKTLRLASISYPPASDRLYKTALQRLISVGATEQGSVGIGGDVHVHVMALGPEYYVYLTREGVLDDDWPTFTTDEVMADRVEFVLGRNHNFLGLGTCFAGNDEVDRTSYFGVFVKNPEGDIGPRSCLRLWKASGRRLRIVRVSRRRIRVDPQWRQTVADPPGDQPRPWYLT